MSKYSEATLEKAINMTFQVKGGEYYIYPSSEKDVYKHKVTIKLNNFKERIYVCGCKWSQIDLVRKSKLCSHKLGVLYLVDRESFWEEVEDK